MLDAMVDKFPGWVGTVPQWGMFILLAIAVVRTSPQWLSTYSSMRLAASNRNRDRIRELEEEVHRCHRECEERIGKVGKELQGMRDQRVTEQLALMRAVVRMSGDPQVKQQLELLEAIQAGRIAAANQQDEDDVRE